MNEYKKKNVFPEDSGMYINCHIYHAWIYFLFTNCDVFHSLQLTCIFKCKVKGEYMWTP